MTRYENFMQIAHSYYDAYVSQAKCLGMKPLSYDEWLKTDKNEAPGFAKDDSPKNCKQQCRDACGRFTKDNFDELKKMAERVDKARGPAPSLGPQKPNEDKPDIDDKYFVFNDGKLLRGEAAKQYFIEKGLIPKDDEANEDSEEDNGKDNDKEYEEAVKEADRIFNKVLGRSIKDFM